MRQSILRCLMVAAILASMCGSASAETDWKDWYGALRLGYQPYTLEVEGTFRGQNFDAEADLSDIMDEFDTTIAGGELEIGTGRYFFLVGGFYQKTEIDEGQAVRDVVGEFKKTAINPMLGYRVYQAQLGGDQSVAVDLMAGAFYVKMEADLTRPFIINEDIDFVDPMVGARVGYKFTKNWGVGASGEIGGFGVGSELQYVVAANLGYDITHWLKVFGGYKYWYFKYEDDGAQLSELEHTQHGPVLGVQFSF